MYTEFPFFISGSALLGLRKLVNDGLEGKARIVYIDPPYFTASEFQDSEKEKSAEKAKADITKVFETSRKVLRDDGILILHCDYRSAGLYLPRLIELFGKGNLVNEIIWQFKRPSNRIMKLVNCHDNLYVFRKTDKYKINTEAEETKAVSTGDVWDDIDSLKASDIESKLYFSSKPISLYSRIVKLFSDENDIIVDAYTGSGAMLIAADKLGRRPIGIDSSLHSFVITTKRFEQIGKQIAFTKIEEADIKESQKEIEHDALKHLEEDRVQFSIRKEATTSSAEIITRKLVQATSERVNNALAVPIDLLKKVFFLIAFAFPGYLLINLIVKNIFWLIMLVATFTFLWILFTRYSFKLASDSSLFTWRTIVTVIILNIIIAFASYEVINQKELVKTFKEIIK